MLFVCPPKILHKRCLLSFSWELKWPQEKLKTMLIQNFGVTHKKHYGMLWYFLEWSIALRELSLIENNAYTKFWKDKYYRIF